MPRAAGQPARIKFLVPHSTFSYSDSKRNNNSGGIFYCHDKKINIDSENGFINLENICPCNKTFTVFYNLNSVICQQDAAAV